MAASYSPSDLKTNQTSLARFMLGDTGALKDAEGVKVWMLQDEEVAALIELWGFAEGVAQCADNLATRYAQEPDQYEDEAGIKVTWSQKVKTWQAVAAKLRAGTTKTAASTIGSPILSGASSGPDMTGVRP